MVRLKSLNLKLKFHTFYNTHPVIIKYKGLIVKNEIDIFLKNCDQKEFIEVSGFDHRDKDQKVICSIFYQNKSLDVNVLCSFQMKDNMYVNNAKLSKYHEIYFNGELELRFFKEWFECNLLSGMTLNNNKTGYINHSKKYEDDYSIDRSRIHPLKNYDIICIGASMVHGTEQLDKSKTWPAQLQNMLNLNVGNFGVQGNDHFGVLQNIEYVIHKFNVKKIILLFPFNFILPKRVEFLGKYVFLMSNVEQYWFFKSEKEAWLRKNILKETFIKIFLSKKLKKIEQMCADRNIDLSLIYHSTEQRDEFNYSSTRFENFVFPEYSAEQTLENNHPDETVHLKFAKQLVENL